MCSYGNLFADQFSKFDEYLLMRITMMRTMRYAGKINCNRAIEYESVNTSTYPIEILFEATMFA
jgi:hypothetical protein